MNEEQKPGSVISPGAQPERNDIAQSEKIAPLVANVALENTTTQEPNQDTPDHSILPGASQQDFASTQEDNAKLGPNVSWTASEFIDHAKSLNWYLVLAVCGVLSAVVVYFITKDLISTFAIAIVAIIFGVSASVRPRVLPYEITNIGVRIDGKMYQYGNYKSFALMHDGGVFSSVQLMPLKRFAPPVSMYFPPEEEQAIVTALSQYLPYEERKADATDRLLKKIRF